MRRSRVEELPGLYTAGQFCCVLYFKACCCVAESNMAQPTDQSLLLRIQKGDEEALLAFHDRYASLVYSVAYRVLGESPAAEEVTQDTFMQIWRKAQTYDESKGAVVTWLVTIARRMAIDAYRKRQRRPLSAALLTDEQLDLWENLLETDDGGDLRRNLIAVMEQLPTEQRQALELAYFYGMTHSEMADYLQLPLGTIKTRIRAGMQKLRLAWLDAVQHPERGDLA